MRTLVGLSGGVDSNVTAWLLKNQGHEVTGVTFLLWAGDRQGRSCSTSDETAAAKVAEELNIKHIIVDSRDAFKADIVDPFIDNANNGITTNPCLACNNTFKLGALAELAETQNYDHYATGHYAQIKNGLIKRGKDPKKDQSYFLAQTNPEHNTKLLLPLGTYHKHEIKKIATEHNLTAAGEKESMDLCIDRKTLVGATPVTLRLSDGTPVGTHQAGETLVVGQRHGLGIWRENPTYVLDVNMKEKEINVGNYQQLETRHQKTSNWTWYETPKENLVCQTSAHEKPHQINKIENNHIHWVQPTRIVTPGQTIVAYQNDTIIGHTTAVKNN